MSEEWNRWHSGSVNPADLLHFVYLDEFVADWRTLYPADVDEKRLFALELAIMATPDGPPVIPGTGGLRKVRFGSVNEGKSGSNRICYALFPLHHIVVMVMAYPKNVKDNLTAEDKKGIKQYLQIISDWLDVHS